MCYRKDMPSVHKLQTLSEMDYLDGELHSEVRHEYVDGAVYAMVGSTARHNLISLALAARLRAHLTGTGCSTFMSDMKVRSGAVFYYPDVLVTCASIAPDALYVIEPRLIVEVLSESTQGRDRLEKWIAYRSLESLQEYVLVAQEEPAVEVYRRTPDGWEQLSFGPDEDLELASVNLGLPIREIYAA